MKKKRLTKLEEQDAKLREVTGHTYFDIIRESRNEQSGLMIGTAVKKIEEPKSKKSDYWSSRDYWSVKVECPNGELKTIGIDALQGRKTAKPFLAQSRAMNFTFSKKKAKVA